MARRRHRRRRWRPLGRKKRGTCPAFTIEVDPGSDDHYVTLDALGPNGEMFGRIDVGAAPSSEYAEVHGIRVREPVQRCGVGTRLYEAALEWACSRGRRLRSDTLRTKYSEAFWRKQEKKDRARCVEDPIETGRELILETDEPGRMWDCDFYEMKEACPADRSLRGKRKRRKRKRRRR